VHHCTSLWFNFAQRTGRVHVTCSSRLRTLIPLSYYIFIYSGLIHYLHIRFSTVLPVQCDGSWGMVFWAGEALG